MKCPNCESLERSKVLETRAGEGAILRRRECSTCGDTFGTREHIDPELRMGAMRPGAYKRKTPKAEPEQSKSLWGVWR